MGIGKKAWLKCIATLFMFLCRNVRDRKESSNPGKVYFA